MLIRVHDGEIAGVQPATGIDSAGGCLWLLVIAFHDLVTARTQFSLLTYRQSFAGNGGNDFHFGIGEGAADGPDALLHRIERVGHGDQRRCLRLAIQDKRARHTRALGDAAHQLHRRRRAARP